MFLGKSFKNVAKIQIVNNKTMALVHVYATQETVMTRAWRLDETVQLSILNPRAAVRVTGPPEALEKLAEALGAEELEVRETQEVLLTVKPRDEPSGREG
jgi:malonyl CoA-acyl carrier protein transacylase